MSKRYVVDSDRFSNLEGDILEYFTHEKYIGHHKNRNFISLFYQLKPVLPRKLQIALRKTLVLLQKRVQFPKWPIESYLENLKRQWILDTCQKKGQIPFIWFWPQGKKFAFVITHDVEDQKGLRNIGAICEIEERYGFRSSWNFVPERYSVEPGVLDGLANDGFEIGIHGLKHDGKLFNSRRIFDERIKKIERYAIEWDAVGFRSPATHRNVDWMTNIPFEYDSSFPDTDPYEPQPGGCLSIFPFFIGNVVELPITLAQDHTLFEILGYKDISIWKQKIDWIEKMNGLALVIVHGDYVKPSEGRGRDKHGTYAVKHYEELLQYVKNKGNYWHALAQDVARWWRGRDASEIRFDENGEPHIKGPAAEGGVITWIKSANNEVLFEFRHTK